MPKIIDMAVEKIMQKGLEKDQALRLARNSMSTAKEGLTDEEFIAAVEKLAEEEKRYAMETFEIANVEVFAAGTWNGDTYTTRDLDDMVKTFKETSEKIKPFVKIGHGDEQSLLRADEMPAAGWVTDLYRSGDKLFANFSRVPKKIYDLIRAGAYRTVSSEIYWDIEVLGKKFRRMLKAVALLGSEMPAVTDLNDIMALYTRDSAGGGFKVSTEPKFYSISKTDLSQEGSMNDLEKAQAALTESNKKLEEASAKLKEYEEKLAKATGDKTATEAELKKLSTEVEALKAENRKVAINSRIDKLISDGKVLPAQRTDLFNILVGGSAEKKYSVGEKQYDTMEAAMFAFIESGPKIAPPTTETTETGKRESNDLDSRAKDYAEKHKVSYKDALTAISRETGAKA